jgi:hypothetical protein
MAKKSDAVKANMTSLARSAVTPSEADLGR